MFGHGYFGAGYYGPGYFGPGAAAAAAVRLRRGASKPPTRYYLPPHWKEKQPTEDEVRKLYIEARKVIPQDLQHGLLPLDLQIKMRQRVTLPPVANVDFTKLTADLATVQVLIAALADAWAKEAKRQKRIRDENEFISMLMELL